MLLFLGAFTFAPPPCYAQEAYDPWEGFNRGIFWFNDSVDVYLFEPLAQGYDYVTPNIVQTGVGNFFRNIRSPVYLVSDLVQLKFAQFGTHSARFLLNSTVGLAGLIDVAERLGLEHHPEDFGISLAYYGVPDGPYLVLPFLGPSNVRDGLGRLVDAFLTPTFYIGTLTDLSSEESLAASGGLYLLDSVDSRANLLEAVESAKEASVDYYLFVRGAYQQRREHDIYDGKAPGKSIDEMLEEE